MVADRKVAIVHDWLISMAGAERVLESICSIYKESPIFTLFYDKASVEKSPFENRDIYTSFLQHFPKIEKIYRNLFPFFGVAVEGLDLSGYDVIISSSHAVAKGFKKKDNQLHICYCHTPSRYVWDMYEDYANSMPVYKRPLFSLTVKYMRKWDLRSTEKVDYFIASSRFVAERIKKIYKRNAHVIYPPVDVEDFKVETDKDDYYIFISRLTNAYKKCDIVIEAFNRLDKKLLVIGDGEDRIKLQKRAKNNIKFLGWQNKKAINYYLGKAKALIFPSIDDFGIVSVEAQACGTPVIAYRGGGALETVIENKTGLFFDRQDVDSLVDAVRKFEKVESQFDPYILRNNAEKFSRTRFEKEFRDFTKKKINSHFN